MLLPHKQQAIGVWHRLYLICAALVDAVRLSLLATYFFNLNFFFFRATAVAAQQCHFDALTSAKALASPHCTPATTSKLVYSGDTRKTSSLAAIAALVASCCFVSANIHSTIINWPCGVVNTTKL